MTFLQVIKFFFGLGALVGLLGIGLVLSVVCLARCRKIRAA